MTRRQPGLRVHPLAQHHHLVDAQVLGDLGARGPRDDRTLELGHLPFHHAAGVLVKLMADHQPQHGVAEEFQALVALGARGRHRRVGQGKRQQPRIVELVADDALAFKEGGVFHVSLPSRSRPLAESAPAAPRRGAHSVKGPPRLRSLPRHYKTPARRVKGVLSARAATALERRPAPPLELEYERRENSRSRRGKPADRPLSRSAPPGVEHARGAGGPAHPRLAEKMFELMFQARGVGLAAPQVGLTVRLFVASPTYEPTDQRVYINPSILSADGTQEGEEGCLSFPGIVCNIKRANVVTIQATNLDGQVFQETGEGLAARIFQHESDHLDGRLLTDRMGTVARLANRRALRDLEEEFAEAGA